jgi:hypothetical protein
MRRTPRHLLWTSPFLTLQPEQVEFGGVAVGGRSAPQIVRLRNEGQHPLDLEVAGLGDDSFVVETGDAKLNLQPGEAGQFSVVFAPARPAPRARRSASGCAERRSR